MKATPYFSLIKKEGAVCLTTHDTGIYIVVYIEILPVHIIVAISTTGKFDV